MFYILALGPFLYKQKVDPVLCEIMLPGGTSAAKYFAYADDASAFAKNTTKIDEVSK